MAPPPVPPSLPPSVEEAYRRKCIQLKQRMNEVEDANDASRQRIIRMERSVQKMRLERAFLLEQLSKRTSTNVEDSDGSPSPPPTPKEKPLRTKRGHRKPSFLANIGEGGRTNASFNQQGPVTLSPSSDAFSHLEPLPQAAQAGPGKRQPPANGQSNPSNGASSPPQVPARSGFDIYCHERRPVIKAEQQKTASDGSFDLERTLAIGWQEMSDERRGDFQRRVDNVKWSLGADKELSGGEVAAGPGGLEAENKNTAEADEDVLMGDDRDITSSPARDAGGFTSVNQA